ncbi:MAG TPA: hypothetical protein VFQ43_10180 [Nitrososphaera sp.]|nr:hypothetical protein [Nitrososphaera sp.]
MIDPERTSSFILEIAFSYFAHVLQRSIAAAQALAVHGLEAECCVPPLGAQYRDNRYIVGMSGTDILP